MQAEKEKFIAKHKIKKSAAEAMENVKLSGDKTVVQIPRKRSDNEDDSGDEIAAIERKVRSKMGDKKFSNKRQRTN